MNKHTRAKRQRLAAVQRHWPGIRVAAVFLLAALGACEVQWGGVQVKAGEPEFEKPAALEAGRDTAVELPPLAMPTGPVLFHVRRLDAAGDALIDPIAELVDGELRIVGPEDAERSEEYASAFISRYYASDQPYTLFRDGARVGTFYTRGPRVSGTATCLVLAAEGRIELRPGADTLSEFVAWAPHARSAGEDVVTPGYREDMVALSQVLARRAVSESKVSGSWRLGLPSDLRALNVGMGRYGFAATFMVGDTLAPGSPADSAGSVFIVADHAPAVGYFPIFSAVDWYGRGGKRALRWLDALDLLDDPEPEWLLVSYGDGATWYEVVAKRGSGRRVVWSGRRPECGVPGPKAQGLPGSVDSQ